jgi:hypothetical protein
MGALMPIKPPRPGSGHYGRLIYDLDCKRQRTLTHFQISLEASADIIRQALDKIAARRRRDRQIRNGETMARLREVTNG